MAKKFKWDTTLDWLLLFGGVEIGLKLLNFSIIDWLAELIKIDAIATILYAFIGVAAILALYKKFK